MKSKEIDLSRVRTVPLASRTSKVGLTTLARPPRPADTLTEFFATLPDVLAARDLRDAGRELARRHRSGAGIVLGMGAHAIKVGLSPLIIDLVERGIVTAIAMNGAGIIHDYELASVGQTSEDVAGQLADGSFGMWEETGRFLNDAAREGAAAGLGLGEAVGRKIEASRFPHGALSIVAAAVRRGVPATVHVAVGTDIVHMHPAADGAAIGATSLRDFRILAGVVAALEGGAFVNLGSAVVIPEVFVKALNLARNTGHLVRDLWTIDMDFIRHYRPAVNVVNRPTLLGGRGIHLTGHHEIMFPLLFAAILSELERS